MSKLRCAVVGVGYLGAFHAQKYAQLADVELLAVCDTNEQRLAEVAATCSVPGFIDYRELLDKVDAVSIAAPTHLHYRLAKDFLSHGVSVLLEKPMCNSIAEADHLIALAKQHKAVLQIGHLERFNPALLALEHELLVPLFIETHRLAPFNPRGTDVNVILDLMIHDIDIIQNIVKSPITEIDATGTPILCDSIDIANARIKFASGCIANVTASRSSFKAERKMRIFQLNAYISIDFQQKRYAIYRKKAGEVLRSFDQIEQIAAEFPQSDALLIQIQSFIHSVRVGTPPLVSGEEGKEALKTAIEITDRIHRQLQKNKERLYAEGCI